MLQSVILRAIRMTATQSPFGRGRRWRPLLREVAPALGLLALVCVMLWATGEYADHRAAVRLAETSRHLDEFRSGPVGAAWARLRDAWQAEQGRQDVLLARIASGRGAERTRALRDHRAFVLETIEEYELHDEIDEVRRYVARLATCVRAGSCDPDVVGALLGPALWAFRDQHLYYFAFAYGGHDLDQLIATVAPRPERQVLPAAAHPEGHVWPAAPRW